MDEEEVKKEKREDEEEENAVMQNLRLKKQREDIIAADTEKETNGETRTHWEKNALLLKKTKRKGMLQGALLMLLLAAVFFALYVGYINIPIGGGRKLTVFLPTYYMKETEGETREELNYREIDRKIREIDSYLDYAYYYDKNAEEIEDGIYLGMMYGLTEDDYYVDYYNPKEYDEVMDQNAGNFHGIGVTIAMDEKEGLEVIMVTPKGPAEESGIKAGDVIIKVNGEDIRGMDKNEVIDERIKGEDGTRVELTLLRGKEELSLSCERREIDLISVYASMVPGTKTGYIAVSSFEMNTEEQFKDAIDSLLSEGAEGYVIDLRDNGGGDMNAALNMLDYILPDEDARYGEQAEENHKDKTLLLMEQDKSGYRLYHYAEDGHSVELPMVVLMNENSASASEIFAGVLRDYGYQTVGTNSYGKGIIQTYFRLSDGSAVKFTVAEYLLPSETSLHGVGIAPDVPAEPDETLLSEGANREEPDPETDNQLKAALKALSKEQKD